MEPLLPGKAFDGFQGMPSHLKKLAPVEPFNGAVDHRREDPMKGALVAVVANLAEGRHGNAQLFLDLPAYRILGVFAIFDVPPGQAPVGTLKVAHSGVDHHEEVVPGTKDAAGGAQAGRGSAEKKSTHRDAQLQTDSQYTPPR